eukprot:g816.t1
MATFYSEPARDRISGGSFAPAPPTPVPPPEAGSITILAVNGTTLATISKLGDVQSSLKFPMPAAFNDGSLTSWSIRDSPRFVPSKDGVVPPSVRSGKIDPALVNTSGFDLRNDAADVYVFLPGAAAADADTAAGGYGYEELRKEYLKLTGPIPSLPDKSFGTWFSWYYPYNATGALSDIARWKSDDLPLDIWGLDMNWRVTAGGMEGKEYKVNTALFPNMRDFMDKAHASNLAVYMNDHPMQNATPANSDCMSSSSCQLSPHEVAFRWNGTTSLFDMGLDFW